MAKQIVFEIVAEDLGASKRISELRQVIRDINKEIRTGNAQPGSRRFNELTTAAAAAKVELNGLVKSQRDLNKAFKQTQVPTDSIAGLRLEYSRLSAEIENLSASERNSQFGQDIIKRAAVLKSEINKLDQSIGKFYGNVGNYPKGLLSIGDVLTGGLLTGGVVVGVQRVVDVMELGIQQALKYEQALDDLSALTGLRGGALEGLDQLARSLQSINIEGVQITNTGTDILNALKLVGGAQPALLENVDALAEVTKQAIILSRASGDDLEPSVRAVTTVLGQFQLQGGEASRIINELAAGARAGASEIPDTTAALEEFGTVAEINNVTTGEAIALAELLADRQLKGSEAGTQLRNVLTKLAAADVLPRRAKEEFERLGISLEVLRDTSLPLEERLRELAKAEGDLAALTKAFGTENLQAATIITSGIDKFNGFKEAIEGTNEAMDQAVTRSDNAATAYENLQNTALNSLEQKFSSSTGSVNLLAQSFTFLIEQFDIIGEAIDVLIGPITFVLDGISDTGRRIKSLFSESKEEIGSFFDVSKQAIQDDADATSAALYEEATALSEMGEQADSAKLSIGELNKRIKELKEKLEEATPGSDRFRLIANELKQAQSDLKKAKLEAGLIVPKGEKEVIEAAAGSIRFLREEIRKLKADIDQTSPETEGFADKISELGKLDRQLDQAEEFVKLMRELSQYSDSLADPFDAVAFRDLSDRYRASLTGLEKDINDERFEEFKKFQDRAEKYSKDATKRYKEDQIKADEEAAKNREQLLQEAIDTAASTLSQIAAGIFQIQDQNVESQKDKEIAAIEETYEERKQKAGSNKTLQAKLDKELIAERERLEREAAEKRKQIAIKEAIIQGVLGAIEAYPNLILAASIGVLTAFQVAQIKRQQFAEGGFHKNDMALAPSLGMVPDFTNGGYTGSGLPFKDSTGHNVAGTLGSNATVHANEYVAPDWMVKKYNPLFQKLEQERLRFGRKPGSRLFADGGFVGTEIPLLPSTGSLASQINVNAGFSEEQIRQIGSIVGSIVAERSARAVGDAVANSMDEGNRLSERKTQATTTRTV